MFSLRNRFGIPGVISVIALVFAMLGGAYAASSSSSGGKATASKAKRGPRGPKGATGPAGPAGAQGAAGVNGKDGAAGEKGAKGDPGSNGKSVTLTTLTPGQEGCVEGGTKAEIEGTPASKKAICNGEEGQQGNQGAPGSPWTAGGTLPVGSTETGAWTVGTNKAASYEFFGFHLTNTSLSFSVPRAAELAEANLHFVEGSVPSECENASHPGAASVTNPEAAPGNLCVFSETPTGLTFFGLESVGPAGALLIFEVTDTTAAFDSGSWAVTG